ncbi:MAG TPA: DUF2231 domain-containing protein [Glycomyces sp.]|nr:DUF2231 domain-containing protein [Glycomyces sp.]
MESRAKAAGHAVHPMLVMFPLGLLTTAAVFDVLHLVTGGSDFAVASAYMIAAGVVGGVLAAVFGWIDWFATPGATRAKRIGLVHGLGNVVVLALFAVSWLLRAGAAAWDPGALALVCGFTGVVIAAGTAWLGGELVERLGMGVDEGAGPDAPNSLSHPHFSGSSPHGRA